MKKIVLFLAACMLAASEMSAQQLTGRDVIQKVKDRPDGDTRYGEMELTLKKKNGSTRQRKVTSWAMDEGKDTKKMMFFTYPGDVKGTGFLTWDYDQIGKEDGDSRISSHRWTTRSSWRKITTISESLWAACACATHARNGVWRLLLSLSAPSSNYLPTIRTLGL